MRTINLRFADVSVRLSASLALLHKQTAQMQQQQITKASGLEYGESTPIQAMREKGIERRWQGDPLWFTDKFLSKFFVVDWI